MQLKTKKTADFANNASQRDPLVMSPTRYLFVYKLSV